jgi:hypothetical protein
MNATVKEYVTFFALMIVGIGAVAVAVRMGWEPPTFSKPRKIR